MLRHVFVITIGVLLAEGLGTPGRGEANQTVTSENARS